jgi:putative transposase
MGRRARKKAKPPDTIWEVPDALWERIEPLINEAYPPKPTGRPRADLRRALDGIIFRLRSGCQWNKLPERFGDDSTVHRWFQRWCQDGFFEKLWAVLLAECEELGGVDWEWQSADGAMGKARFGGARSAAIRPIEANRGRRRASSSRRMEARSEP